MPRFIPHDEYGMLHGLFTDPMSSLQPADRLALQHLLPRLKPQRDPDVLLKHVRLNIPISIELVVEQQRMQITLVLPQYANPRQKRISLFSPLGEALYGLAEGDETRCQLPLGEKRLRVLEIHPNLATSTSF